MFIIGISEKKPLRRTPMKFKMRDDAVNAIVGTTVVEVDTTGLCYTTHLDVVNSKHNLFFSPSQMHTAKKVATDMQIVWR